VVSDRELEDRPYQPLRATGHGDAKWVDVRQRRPGFSVMADSRPPVIGRQRVNEVL
jgi:hypothetical protein